MSEKAQSACTELLKAAQVVRFSSLGDERSAIGAHSMFAVGAKRQKQTPSCRFVRMVFIAQR